MLKCIHCLSLVLSTIHNHVRIKVYSKSVKQKMALKGLVRNLHPPPLLPANF